MIKNYWEWINNVSNMGYYWLTNFLLGMFIFLTFWICIKIGEYIDLKDKVKELDEKVKKIEKRKKK